MQGRALLVWAEPDITMTILAMYPTLELQEHKNDMPSNQRVSLPIPLNISLLPDLFRVM